MFDDKNIISCLDKSSMVGRKLMAVVIIQELLLVCIFSKGWKITDSLLSPLTSRKSKESEHRVRNLQGREKKHVSEMVSGWKKKKNVNNKSEQFAFYFFFSFFSSGFGFLFI